MTETAIKERPILFTGPMVRAILDGSKTQTRRVIAYVPPQAIKSWVTDGVARFKSDLSDEMSYSITGPYGKPGDRLWVRETWYDDLSGRTPEDGRNDIYYRADGEAMEQFPENYTDLRWRSPYHMFRWACRLILDVTEIRAERVQEISEADALDEGVWPGEQEPKAFDRVYSECMPIHLFGGLWDSINAAPKPVYARGEDGKKFVVSYVSYPWEEGTTVQEHRGKPHHVYGNPWVWPISFKRLEASDG